MRTNPIKTTVTHFVPARGQGKSKHKKMTTIGFFVDLENRGLFQPFSLFEKWTREIRKEMQREGIWITDDEDQYILFVSQYISRLQQKFLDACPGIPRDHHIMSTCRYAHEVYPQQLNVFKTIYLKVRVWGLRMKKYALCKFCQVTPLISYVDKGDFSEEYMEQYGNRLYTHHQMWSRNIHFNREDLLLQIDPVTTRIPWRKGWRPS